MQKSNLRSIYISRFFVKLSVGFLQKFCTFFCIFAYFFAFVPSSVFSSNTSLVQATVTVTVCGNGEKEFEESCDGADLNNATCSSLGFSGGSLSCRPSCEFNTSSCSSSGSGGGGSGGGGGNSTPVEVGPIETTISFSGRAYPLSQVVLLKDGQIALQTIAGPDARFDTSLKGLSAGNYVFSLYSQDSNGKRSSLFTFSVFVTNGATTKVSGVFLSPTISVSKAMVKKGDDIAIFGQSVPKGNILISLDGGEKTVVQTLSDAQGVYLYNLDTATLDFGQYLAQSKSSFENEKSPFGESVSFSVLATSPKEKTETQKDIPLVANGGFNNDGRINLVDFSIAAYWYKRPLSQALRIMEKELFNGDGKIDLVDFSIMAFYWTG